ncbi:3-oxo-5-alpha-steroid 4-dehydrogenase [Microbacter margulisiae]|uniref:3-oxo-5-alpha-steroid 4-dehydrogenase 1 n=1 Tax=Microbacter margulisiae TaxID=1350067 RepID=A0A7W5H220_9PORP|nr:3-oxo-5-alpha-steroid 4-dehydrogenase [Microbacter margulisiae]MBB3187174.1 steroid 5-alpha reductase family enzyme [Microbacter margulisiae]
MTLETLRIIAFIWIAMAVIVHITLFYVTAPFGRHTTDKWGWTVNNKLAWVVMEFPSLFVMVYFLLAGSNSMQPFVWLLFALWIIHYINRSLIYPFRIRKTPRKMPVIIMLSAIFFNIINAGLNGYYLASLAPVQHYNATWLGTPHFLIGIILFLTGIFINWKADNILIHLRKPGETEYKIPQGWLFDFVSSPNLLGEIIEWTGFALMAWNLPAFTFMIWTWANLIPRARNHHEWYLLHFPNYPRNRKIILPFMY